MASSSGIAGSPRLPMRQQRIGLARVQDLHSSLAHYAGDLKGIQPAGFLNNISQANIQTLVAEATSPAFAVYTAQPTDFILMADCTNGPLSIFLPPSSTAGSLLLWIKLVGNAYPCEVFPGYGSPDSIDGGSIRLVNLDQGVFLLNQGNTWRYFFEGKDADGLKYSRNLLLTKGS